MSDKKIKLKNIDPMILPSSNEEMEKFIIKNRVEMYAHTIRIIENAIANKEPIAEVYRFDGSSYAVVMHDIDYKENLDFIFGELLKLEEYELCAYAKPVKEMVDSLVQKLRTNYITK